jgi:hypothetical protein
MKPNTINRITIISSLELVIVGWVDLPDGSLKFKYHFGQVNPSSASLNTKRFNYLFPVFPDIVFSIEF